MSSLLFNALRMTERKFNNAYYQVQILNNKIEQLTLRYDRARKNHHEKFCYSLKLQISVLEGTRNMYYEYVQRMAFTLDTLQKNAGLIDVDMEDVSENYLSDDFSDDDESKPVEEEAIEVEEVALYENAIVIEDMPKTEDTTQDGHHKTSMLIDMSGEESFKNPSISPSNLYEVNVTSNNTDNHSLQMASDDGNRCSIDNIVFNLSKNEASELQTLYCDETFSNDSSSDYALGAAVSNSSIDLKNNTQGNDKNDSGLFNLTSSPELRYSINNQINIAT